MWTVVLLIAVLTLLFLWRKRSFSVLRDMGIPGPNPNIIFGNLLELASKTPLKCTQEWIDKYGKVLGYYFGSKPVVMITDVNLLKRIQVSEFHKFVNRGSILRVQENKRGKPRRVEGFSQQLIVLRDKRWKEIRSIITPTFTASKMKQMTPIMFAAIDTLMEKIEKKSSAGESFDIYPMYQGLTMDVIGRTAFGINTDVQNNPQDPLLRSSKLLFSNEFNNPLAIIAVSFRSLQRVWSWLGRFRLMLKNKGTSPVKELIDSVKEVIATRRTSKEIRRNDLLQLMIDAKADDVASVTSNDLTADDDDKQEKQISNGSSGKATRQMTDDEILDNALLFFLAGYETTSTALAFITHMLVNFPDAQEKVIDEVQQLLKQEGELDYYSVNKLQYLDQVIHESLRLYPPIYLFVSRESSEDTDLGNFRIAKGTSIQVPVFNLHRDPDLWPDPEEFKPERFAPENKSQLNPLAFQPFGAGPRNCVGMRFALMEIKMTLAKILSKYKLKPCSETDKEPVSLLILSATIKPKNGVYLKAVPY